MNTLTVSRARDRLDETIRAVCENHEPVVITNESNDSVVVISVEDFKSVRETAYLLSEPANAERLRRSMADVKAGKTFAFDLDDL